MMNIWGVQLSANYGRATRLHLSKDAHKNEKDVLRSKSFHIASITEMADHRGVDFFDPHACSGHSLGTNQERYLDQNIRALTLSGAYALNGWVDATPKKLYPPFHRFGPHMTEKYHFLIKELYIVSVPKFKRDGSLYPVLLSETASLVIYHHCVGTHLGHKNYVYTKLCKSAKNQNQGFQQS